MPKYINVARFRTARLTAIAALVVNPLSCGAEKFTPFGTQPDGSETYVQAAPPTLRADGKFQGWFRTVPKDPRPIVDEFGFERKYADFLALNVADCLGRRMGVATMSYRDEAGTTVAVFRRPPAEIEYREIHPATLAQNMYTWLCSPAPRPPSGRLPPSAAGDSPFR